MNDQRPPQAAGKGPFGPFPLFWASPPSRPPPRPREGRRRLRMAFFANRVPWLSLPPGPG